jgi:molecular chaperone DnaK (HSP70)
MECILLQSTEKWKKRTSRLMKKVVHQTCLTKSPDVQRKILENVYETVCQSRYERTTQVVRRVCQQRDGYSNEILYYSTEDADICDQ